MSRGGESRRRRGGGLSRGRGRSALEELARDLSGGRGGSSTRSDPAGGSEVNVLSDNDSLPVGGVLRLDVTLVVGTLLVGADVRVVVRLGQSQRGKAKSEDGGGLHFVEFWDFGRLRVVVGAVFGKEWTGRDCVEIGVRSGDDVPGSEMRFLVVVPLRLESVEY